MLTNVKDFLPYLYSMQAVYSAEKVQGSKYAWFMNRTDEIAVEINSTNELIITCQGTEPKIRDWVWNLWAFSTEWLNMGKVHSGFARNIEELVGREDEPHSLITLCKVHAEKGGSIIIQGHSRGYPLACLLGTLLVSHDIDKSIITIVGCAGARLGNKKFKKEFNKMLGGRVFQLNSKYDPVTYVPPLGQTLGKLFKLNIPKHRLVHYIKKINEISS